MRTVRRSAAVAGGPEADAFDASATAAGTTVPFAAAPVVGVAAVVVAVLLALSTRYGFHRDELYYLWGGEHLDWGYVDHPPIVPLVARVADLAGGSTLFVLRLLAALVAGWLVIATALVARELGGTRRAQVMAAFAAACVPATRAPEILYGTTAADAAGWAVVLVVMARMLRTQDRRLWLWIGLATGIGLETKWSIGVLVVGFVAGLALTPQRRLLWSGWTVAGGAVALVLWAPNLWWNATHDWAFLEFQRNVGAANGTLDKRLLFVPMLVLLAGVAPIVVWGPGWMWLRRTPFAPLAIASVVMAALVFLAGGKPYYLAPLLLPLLAAGAVALDQLGPAGDGRRRSAITILAVTAIVTVPLTLPVLPPSALGAIAPVNPEMGEMIGWPELVAETRGAFASLPANEQAHAVIVTSNYSSATALLRDAPELPAYSAHNSLWFEGPPPDTATTVVTVGYRLDALETWCADARQIGTVTNAAGLANMEADRPIYTCRLARPWSETWPDLKHYR